MKIYAGFYIFAALLVAPFLQANVQSVQADPLFRLKPSTPKDLLDAIYNNVLIGNDRLSDIENYMSSGLKNDYKKALKITKKGGKCELPRILSNGVFSGKLKGFNVDQVKTSGWSTEVTVTLDTGSKNLSSTSELIKFDPKIYEPVHFYLTKRFIDWKIDDIRVSTPDLDHINDGVSYKSIDLREALKTCK